MIALLHRECIYLGQPEGWNKSDAKTYQKVQEMVTATSNLVRGTGLSHEFTGKTAFMVVCLAVVLLDGHNS